MLHFFRSPAQHLLPILFLYQALLLKFSRIPAGIPSLLWMQMYTVPTNEWPASHLCYLSLRFVSKTNQDAYLGFCKFQTRQPMKIYILNTVRIVWANHRWFWKKFDYLTWQNVVLISTFPCNLTHWMYSKMLMNWKFSVWGWALTYAKCTGVYVVSKYIKLELYIKTFPCWKSAL